MKVSNNKKYTVYKITNLINGKIYIGAHETSNLNDSYMGSGNAIQNAIKKYGAEFFEKEYIFIFDNRDEMYETESKLVNEDFIKDRNTYNIKLGGLGGNGSLNSWKWVRRRLKELQKDEIWVKKRGKKISDVLKRGFKSGRLKNSFTDCKHTDETKKIIGRKNSVHQKGSGNSQFGTMWIYNIDLKETKKIKKEEIKKYLNVGWKAGRKMKF